MPWINFSDLPEDCRVEIVQKELNYLETEGVVVKIGDKYRMKTPKEIQKELQDIFNS